MLSACYGSPRDDQYELLGLMPDLIRTRRGWLDALAAASPAIAALGLSATLEDATYFEGRPTPPSNADALNFANCAEHTTLLVRAIEHLAATGCSTSDLKKWLTDLTSGETYGTVCELGAYALLAQAGLPFTAQVSRAGAQTLNHNRATLDGRFNFGEDLYFDIKAFGFHDRLLGKLQRKLSQAFPDAFVAMNGGIHVPIAMLNGLLGRDYRALVSELRATREARRPPLQFELQTRRKFQVTQRQFNVEKLAAANADYAFGYAKQFTRLSPFLLIFVLHPWFGGLTFTTNFAGDTDRFMAAFATATFANVSTAIAPKTTTAIGRAAPLLSGMLFLNIWSGSNAPEQGGHYLLLNPSARFPLPAAAISALRSGFGNRLTTI